METIFWALLEASVRATLIVGGVGAILAVARVKSPAIRHAAWTGVLLAMLLLPMVVVWMPKVPVRLLPPQNVVAMPELMVIPQDEMTSRAVEREPRPQANVPVSRPREWSWHELAAIAYLIGLCAMLLRFGVGTLQVHRLVRRASETGGVLHTSSCAAPVTVGLFAPKVLLPADWHTWSQEKLDCVLAHEREHVRRRDPLVLRLSGLNRCIFWFQPLAWWIDRKLAQLAEAACDEAVLTSGHDATHYARCLVELARSVEQAGARVAAWGSAVSGSTLPARINLILRGERSAPVSRSRVAVVASLCGAILVVLSACRLDRAQMPAPGQPTMNELMHRREAERSKRMQEQDAQTQKIRALAPGEVRALEVALRNNPQDRDTRGKLESYYAYSHDQKNLTRHVLWDIEHEPERGWWASSSIDPAVDREGYERGKRVWLAHMKKPGASAVVVVNAGRFVAATDKSLAERILLTGQKTYPDFRGFRSSLAELYYQVLVGAAGPLVPIVRSVNLEAAHGEYAQQIRDKLARSDDPELLTMLGMRLISFGTQLYRHKQIDFDPFPLGKSYLDRALAIQPNLKRALLVQRRIESETESQEYYRLQRSGRLEQVFNESDEADRLKLLSRMMNDAFHRNTLDEAEARARELLKLAARSPGAQKRGSFLFSGNIVLGTVALRRGDKRTAGRYLIEAAKAPVSTDLSHARIGMDLPRALVDWGERDTVAEFLERCAKFNDRREELTLWATQIRRGINPDLEPYSNDCKAAPCNEQWDWWWSPME